MSSLSDELTKEKFQAIKTFLFFFFFTELYVVQFSYFRMIVESRFPPYIWILWGKSSLGFLSWLILYKKTSRQAVRMREILARPWVGACVALALSWSDTFQNTP